MDGAEDGVPGIGPGRPRRRRERAGHEHRAAHPERAPTPQRSQKAPIRRCPHQSLVSADSISSFLLNISAREHAPEEGSPSSYLWRKAAVAEARRTASAKNASGVE